MSHPPHPDEYPYSEEDEEFFLPRDDPRYTEVAKCLAAGYHPTDAVQQAYNIPHNDPDLPEFALQVVQLPQVKELLQAIVKSVEPSYGLTLEETRAYLRAAVLTPLSQINEDSPLCQSSKTQYNPKTGQTSSEIKSVDKLKALDMDNRLQGRYKDSLAIGPSEDLLDMISQARSQSNTNALPESNDN